MRELDERIAAWRRGMQLDAEALDELEAHLRDDVQQRVGGGMNVAAAFELAVARLGTKEAIVAEYGKVERTPRFVKVVGIAWVVAVIAAAAVLLRGLMSGRLTGVLYAHILAVLAGYLLALVAGGFGITLLFSGHKRAMRKAIALATPLVAVLIAVAIVLAMIWTRQTRASSMIFDPKAIAATIALAWFVAMTIVIARKDPWDETVALLAIIGNIVISWAWFGTGIAVAGSRTYWSLMLLVLGHAVLAVKVIQSRRNLRAGEM